MDNQEDILREHLLLQDGVDSSNVEQIIDQVKQQPGGVEQAIQQIRAVDTRGEMEDLLAA